MREVRSGSSYLGQNELRMHFGLAAATTIERLEIRWPTGQVEIVTGVGVNQIVTITEGKGVTARALNGDRRAGLVP
jgi:predicted xylose isomerase-like sugar epimerase